MIFDFKTNRFVAVIGIIGLFGMVFSLTVSFELDMIWIFLISLIYVFILAKYMKYIASVGYREIHQKLFVHGNAKGYLEAVKKLYNGIKKHKDFEGVKLQNLIMAYIFSGDYEAARKYHAVFVETFKDELDRHESVRFSRGMIDTLLVMFEFDSEAFVKSYDEITAILDNMKPETVEHVRTNPYSIYYMMTQVKHLVVDSEEVTIDDVKALIKEDTNVFLKTSILYMLFKNGFLDEKYLDEFEKDEKNTMFYLDEDRVY